MSVVVTLLVSAYLAASSLLLVGATLRWNDAGEPAPGKVVVWALVAPALIFLLFVAAVTAYALAWVGDYLDASPPERSGQR